MLPNTLDGGFITERSYEGHNLDLWDLGKEDDYSENREIMMPGTDVFLICFNLCQPKQLENVSSKWVHEIEKYTGTQIPCILVGCRSDERELLVSGSETVTHE